MNRITQQIADEIRRRYAEGGITQVQLAAEFNLGQSQISRIVTGQSQIGKPSGVRKGHKFGPQSPEHIAKRFANGAGAQKNKKQTPEHVEKCRQLRIGKKINAPHRSEEVRERWGAGIYDELFKRNTKFIYADGTPMRSNWERLAAAYFDETGLEWQYEPRRFVLPSKRHYYPDFYLPRLDLYVEIKGFATYNATAKFDEFVGLGYNAAWVTGQTDAEFLEDLKAQVREVTA